MERIFTEEELSVVTKNAEGQVIISQEIFAEQIRLGWKKSQLAAHYELTPAAVTTILKQLGLKIRRFQKPAFVFASMPDAVPVTTGEEKAAEDVVDVTDLEEDVHEPAVEVEEVEPEEEEVEEVPAPVKKTPKAKAPARTTVKEVLKEEEEEEFTDAAESDFNPFKASAEEEIEEEEESPRKTAKKPSWKNA